MKRVTCTIKGMSPLQQNRAHETPKKSGESNNAYEERTWKNRAHVLNGQAIHPGNALKIAIVNAATKRQESVPEKGRCKFKGFFEAGIMVRKVLKINKTEKDIQKVAVFGSSTGKKGGGSRVWKYFPTYDEWEAECEIIVLDETITEEVMKTHLAYAGIISGLGTWRPQNGGDNGRFTIKKWEWMDFNG